MESKSLVKLLRKLIREEVKAAVRQVLNEKTTNHKQVINHGLEMQRISEQPNPRRKKKQYTKNSMLNDLLNETSGIPNDGPIVSQMGAMNDYPSMDFKSEMADSFGMNRQPQQLATTGINGEPVNMQNEAVAKTVDIMTKDYSGLMKAIDKKNKEKGKR
jgi:hypothetical protein